MYNYDFVKEDYTYKMKEGQYPELIFEDQKDNTLKRYLFLESFYVDYKEILVVLESGASPEVKFFENSDDGRYVTQVEDKEVIETFNKIHQNDDEYEVQKYLCFYINDEFVKMPIINVVNYEGKDYYALGFFKFETKIEFCVINKDGKVEFVSDIEKYRKLYTLLANEM